MTKEYLHLEITSNCHLKCPACPRTIYDGSYLKTEMPLEMIEKIISFDLDFKKIFLCGDHGDPIYHSKFHKVIDYLVSRPNQAPVIICTNGSNKTKEWWKKTAKMLRPIDNIIFGIDGLKHNNHLHRKNSNWNSIDEGILTLREHSQCKITWQWILFSFNENDLRSAAIQAQIWRVNSFTIVKSFREINPLWIPTKSLEAARMDFINGKNISTLSC